MKLLDRYVLTLFVKNYVISLTVLIGLFIAMDMVFHFDDFVAIQDTSHSNAALGAFYILRDVVDYYFYQSFLIFVQLSGIIPVVAAAFTLMRLSRFSELTAFLAAGVPLLRIAVPIVIAAILLNTLVIIDQELLLPRMIPQLTRKQKDVHNAADTAYPIKSMQVDQHALLLCARYHPAVNGSIPYMEEMDVLERDDVNEPVAHLFATTATWDNAAHLWTLASGFRVNGLQPGQTLSKEEPTNVYRGDVTPEEINLYHSSSFVDLLSTRRINELLARPKSYGAAGLYRMKHLRVTQPLMNIVLLLLAIPMVLTHDPKTLKTAATKCLVLTGAAMGCVFLSQQMASNPVVPWINGWAALMAWLPIFVFGPTAAWLLDRVRT